MRKPAGEIRWAFFYVVIPRLRSSCVYAPLPPCDRLVSLEFDGHALARMDTLTPGIPGYPPAFDEAALRNFLRVTSTPFHPHGDTEFALAPFPRFKYPVPISWLMGEMLKTFGASRHTDLEPAPITAKFVDGTCVIARRGSRLPRSEHSRLKGAYTFTFVATNGMVHSKQLDVSRFLSWHPEDRWDGSLDHKLLNIRTSEADNLFGTWQEVGSHGV